MSDEVDAKRYRYLRANAVSKEICEEGDALDKLCDAAIEREENGDFSPCGNEAYENGCCCYMSAVGPRDINPPEPVVDKNCPLHGVDWDAEIQRREDDRAAPWG